MLESGDVEHDDTLFPETAAAAPGELLDFAAAYTLASDNRTVTMTAAKRKRVARNRWFLAYTLLFNPSLRPHRRATHRGASQWYGGGGGGGFTAEGALSVSDSAA